MSSMEANVVFTERLNPLLRGSGKDGPAAAARMYGFPSCGLLGNRWVNNALVLGWIGKVP